MAASVISTAHDIIGKFVKVHIYLYFIPQLFRVFSNVDTLVFKNCFFFLFLWLLLVNSSVPIHLLEPTSRIYCALSFFILLNFVYFQIIKMECQLDKSEHFRHHSVFKQGIKAAEAARKICAVYWELPPAVGFRALKKRGGILASSMNDTQVDQ